jgi:hypothetical protein
MILEADKRARRGKIHVSDCVVRLTRRRTGGLGVVYPVSFPTW